MLLLNITINAIIIIKLYRLNDSGLRTIVDVLVVFY